MSRATLWDNIVATVDVAADDSDKTFTVTTLKQWWVRSIYVKLVTTATGGNRQVDVLFTDASNNIFAKYVAGAVQTASLTREYIFSPGHPQETGFTSGVMLRALSDHFILPEGYKIRVYDSAAIAAAADDMDVRILLEERMD
jgi:hypothetical protein